MNKKIEAFLKKNKKYKLATARDCDNSLIYVDNLKAWEEDTGNGDYQESKNVEYNKIVVLVDGSGIYGLSEDECTGRYYGLKSILSDCNDDSNKICAGSSLDDLYAFMKRVRGTSHLYLSYTSLGDKKQLNRKDLKLCYVERGVAYFTNNPEQWGDDWNDSPYQHNAGTPYEDEGGFELLKIGFSSGYRYSEPCDYFYGNTFSVEEVNRRFVPWLIPDDINYEPIFAGESIKEFVKKIKVASGEILLGIKFENYDFEI